LASVASGSRQCPVGLQQLRGEWDVEAIIAFWVKSQRRTTSFVAADCHVVARPFFCGRPAHGSALARSTSNLLDH